MLDSLHFATILPTLYLYTIWDGPPGQIGLSQQYNSELIALDAQPGHKALREDVGSPPAITAYKPPRESLPIHLPPTHCDCTKERGKSRRKTR